jgi:hypothetical protein
MITQSVRATSVAQPSIQTAFQFQFYRCFTILHDEATINNTGIIRTRIMSLHSLVLPALGGTLPLFLLTAESAAAVPEWIA